MTTFDTILPSGQDLATAKAEAARAYDAVDEGLARACS